jgi:hypothetical protein
VKTRLLRRLRRRARNRVYGKWDGYELTIQWKKWVSGEGYVILNFKLGDGHENNDFYHSRETVFKDIDDLKSGLAEARRCAILQTVMEYRSDIIKDKIKKL